MIVFITSHGRRYHDLNKHLLSGSKARVTPKMAEAEGYLPCSYCFADGLPTRPATGRDPSKAYLRLHS